MKIITGLLSMVAGAIVFNTVSAVPRYSTSVPQVGDSPSIRPVDAATQDLSAPVLQRIKQDALSCKDEWSGSLDDLKALVDRAKQNYGSESAKHMGRNATMIVPANLSEMKKWLNSKNGLGNWGAPHFWNKGGWDGYHAKNADKGDGKGAAFIKRFGSGVEKYTVAEKGDFAGAEVVYDKETGEIIKDWRMGTRNFSHVTDADHDEVDMNTHEKKPEYKYVGILVETDSSDPNKYYIVNGQTGKRMTWREAEDFPTTLSDEWKHMGLSCVPDDANDVIEPDECRDEAKCIDTSKLESLKKGTSKEKLDLDHQSEKAVVKDEPLDSCKTTDVAVVERKKDTSQVGVRGWCTCGAEHGKIYQCGVGAFIPGFNLGDYVYELCARCGKILKPNKTDKEAKIFDMRIDRKYRDDSGLIGGIPMHEYEALLKQAENKLLGIPDGSIVIHGTCVCKEPDPIHVGFLDWGYSPYVCILCGRVRLPDKDWGIPNGPTALSEMGLDKQAESARERMLEWIEHNR